MKNKRVLREKDTVGWVHRQASTEGMSTGMITGPESHGRGVDTVEMTLL